MHNSEKKCSWNWGSSALLLQADGDLKKKKEDEELNVTRNAHYPWQ